MLNKIPRADNCLYMKENEHVINSSIKTDESLIDEWLLIGKLWMIFWINPKPIVTSANITYNKKDFTNKTLKLEISAISAWYQLMLDPFKLTFKYNR